MNFSGQFDSKWAPQIIHFQDQNDHKSVRFIDMELKISATHRVTSFLKTFTLPASVNAVF